MGEIKTALKAIRAHCINCACGSKKEVRLCPVYDCKLYLWRFGKNPYSAKKELSSEEKNKQAVKMEKLREMKKKKVTTGV